MRIIYFSFDYSPHDHRFLAALSETQHQVYYVRLQRGPRQVESRPVPENIEIVPWAGGQKPFAWRDLPKLTFDFRRLTQKIKPDLIHAGPVQTCAFIAVLSGFRPILTMSWGFDLMRDVYRGRWWEFATRYTLKRSTFFTSDAQVTRDTAVRYGMDPAKTMVFPWGVNLNQFTPKDRSRVTDDSFTVFCNRAWEPIYGVDVLARAFVQAAAERPQLRLLLLGGGSQVHLIRNILTDGGVLDQVTFAGQINHTDLPRFYQMADLYVSASHVDGSSVSLMEALACGLPCLVSDIPGNKEWVSEGQNGWLFRDGDERDLAAKIVKALENRKSLFQIGQNARMIAEERANWRENAHKLLLAYQKTMEVC